MVALKKALFVNTDKCTGCRLCELACSVSHYKTFSPARSRIRVFEFPSEGKDVPIVCEQCNKCPCVDICPTDAIKRDAETGAIVIDYDLCIGCKRCITACPFGGAMVDPMDERVVFCDLCSGDPECVKYCLTRALTFVTADKAWGIRAKGIAEKLSLEGEG